MFFSRRITSDVESLREQNRDDLLDGAIDGRDPETNWRWAVNVLLTIAVIAALGLGITSPALAFMIGVVLALLVNVPDYEDQEHVLQGFSEDVMTYVGTLLAVGVLIGVLNGTETISEMANVLLTIIPEGLGGVLPVALGPFAMPFSLLFSPDAFYFGVLPVLADVHRRSRRRGAHRRDSDRCLVATIVSNEHPQTVTT